MEATNWKIIVISKQRDLKDERVRKYFFKDFQNFKMEAEMQVSRLDSMAQKRTVFLMFFKLFWSYPLAPLHTLTHATDVEAYVVTSQDFYGKWLQLAVMQACH